MTAADAIRVPLAEHLGAEFLTVDHALVGGPTFPRSVTVLRLAPRPWSRRERGPSVCARRRSRGFQLDGDQMRNSGADVLERVTGRFGGRTFDP